MSQSLPYHLVEDEEEHSVLDLSAMCELFFQGCDESVLADYGLSASKWHHEFECLRFGSNHIKDSRRGIPYRVLTLLLSL
jgi:hypothetical protein